MQLSLKIAFERGLAMEKESECPTCGMLAAEHSLEQIKQCLQRHQEQHSEVKKESEESIAVNFIGPDGGTYQGEVDPESPCPSCQKPFGEHSHDELWACSKKSRPKP
jgi:ribosomal protein L37AE/L43A